MFYGLYDDAARTLTYVNAGHVPPILLRGEGAVLELDSSVPPVGLFPVMDPQAVTIGVGAGDWLLVFSDGVTESTDAGGNEFGRDRLVDVVSRRRGATAEAMRDAIYEAVAAHAAGEPRFDDVTIIAARGR